MTRKTLRRTTQQPDHVRAARIAAGYRFGAAFARELGISPSHLSEIENGTRNCTPVLLHRIAALTDLPVSMLERHERPAWLEAELPTAAGQ